MIVILFTDKENGPNEVHRIAQAFVAGEQSSSDLSPRGQATESVFLFTVYPSSITPNHTVSQTRKEPLSPLCK